MYSWQRQERRAADNLLGRRSSVGGCLSLDLAFLEETLRSAGLAECLQDAVVACHGPIENERARADALRGAWETLFSTLRSRCDDRPDLLRWVDTLARTGMLKRLSGGDLSKAQSLMSTAWQIISRPPQAEILLANLAAENVGDSHALDRGQPLSTLVLRAIAVSHGIDGQDSADARRKAWAAIGVIIDDLSSPVLTFNLRAAVSSELGRVLELHRHQVQPAFLTYRQLQRGNMFQPLDPAMKTVFICENPSVVSAAAREIGSACRALVCTNGHPTSAVHLLLSQLHRAGAELRCHADFDWAGLHIVDQLLREHTAIPWRMNVEDYYTASGTMPLDPQPFTVGWSSELPDAIRERGHAVFEEQVIRSLLQDLNVDLTG